MKNIVLPAASMLIVAALLTSHATAQHAHGAGPNGGVVFDLGSYHAEFTVNHEKGEVSIVALGADEKSTAQVAASEFILVTKETKTADGEVVPPMTIVLLPQDESDGKAARFVGSDPGISNVADFAGTVSGEIDGKPAVGEFDEAGGNSHPTHDGVVAVLKGPSDEDAGFVELKLHDDKGDLELWLGKDRKMKQPIDIPAGSTIAIVFKDIPDKKATLRVRDDQRNEDEDGNPNLREGLTNYFIFPGDSGQDPSWLIGKDFKSVVRISFAVDGKTYTSEEFTLIPHTHADGHGHTH